MTRLLSILIQTALPSRLIITVLSSATMSPVCNLVQTRFFTLVMDFSRTWERWDMARALLLVLTMPVKLSAVMESQTVCGTLFPMTVLR